MQSRKVVKFHVFREEYRAIPPEEKQRIKELLARHIIDDVASRFDGVSSFTVTIHAKGNA